MGKNKQGILFETLPAKERAAILEQEIVEALDSGKFEFMSGVGFLHSALYSAPCGCAVGAACFVLGGRKFGTYVFAAIEDTGFATTEELEALEQGYEAGDIQAPCRTRGRGPFFAMGKRLRARPDAQPSWEPK